MKKTYLLFILIFIVIIVLFSGCGPSEAAIQQAIAETEAAKPTLTNTPEPIKSPTPTLAPMSESVYAQFMTDKITQFLEHIDILVDFSKSRKVDAFLIVDNDWKLGVNNELNSLLDIAKRMTD